MKPIKVIASSLLVIGIISVCHGTFLSTAVGMGFLGGFLMGKLTLGVFLTAMNSINPARPTTRPVPIGIGQSPKDDEFLNIPEAIDVKVRERFLRQLGKIDPLNCLPKAFCEVTADPHAAGSEALSLLSQASPLIGLQESKKKRPKPDDDDYDDNGSSGSESVEDDENDNTDPENVKDSAEKHKLKTKQYLKHEEDLEEKGLEKLINDYEDPLNYFFALKDKNLPVHKDLLSLLKVMDFSTRKGAISRISSNGVEPRKNSGPSEVPQPHDEFEDDPFFQEFKSNIQNPHLTGVGKGGVINVGLLRRNRRDLFGKNEEEDIMTKYRIAAEVGGNRKPRECRRVFNQCPFSADEVMKMINKLNSNENKDGKQNGKLGTLTNTLLAIEKLNDATIQAEEDGVPVNYSKLMNDTIGNTKASESASKIVKEIQEIEDLVPSSQQSPEENVSENVKKYAIRKRKLKKEKKSPLLQTRKRRHDSGSSLFSQALLKMSNRNENQMRGIFSDDNDEFFAKSVEVAKVRGHVFNDDEDSEEFNQSNEPDGTLPKIKSTRPKPTHKPLKVLQKGSETQVSEEVDQDDELNSPESEEFQVKAPAFDLTFTQTFMDTKTKAKPKPKPVHKVVQVKNQTLTRTTSKPKPSSTSKPKRPTQTPTKHKFSGESEDDEEDAINKEKEIDVLVAKYKPKDKLRKTA